MTFSPNEWIKGIASSALICGISLSLCPKGQVKSMLKIITGIIMILSLVSPLLQNDFSHYSIDTGKYINEAHDILEDSKKDYDNLDRTYIETNCETYIQNIARSMGVENLNISIQTEWNNQGFWYPYKATIASEISPQDKIKLSYALESELGIKTSNQIWGDVHER